MLSKALDKVKEAYEIIVQWEADEAAGVSGTTDKPEAKSASEALFAAKMVLKEALRLPPRNCDVGTAEEQQNRFNRFCRPCVDGCPFLECRTIVECAIKWAQMPYEAEEGGEE